MLVACDGKTSLCAPAVGMLAVRNGCAPVGRPFPAGAVPVAAPRGGGGAGPARRACGRAQCWLAVAGCFVSPALLSTGGRSVQEGVRVRDSSRVLLRVIQVRISGRLAERCRLRTRVCRARVVNARACACSFARAHWTHRSRRGQRQLPGVRARQRWGRNSPCLAGAGAGPRLLHDACFRFFRGRSRAAQKHPVVGQGTPQGHVAFDGL